MNTIQKVSDAIVQQGMLPLYFNADENVTLEVLRAIYRAGIKAVEYTGVKTRRRFKGRRKRQKLTNIFKV